MLPSRDVACQEPVWPPTSQLGNAEKAKIPFMIGPHNAGWQRRFPRCVCSRNSSRHAGRVEDWRGVPKVQPSCCSPFPLGVPQ